MEKLKVLGRLQGSNKKLIDTNLTPWYEKGQFFEVVEHNLESELQVEFHSKLLKASGILIREVCCRSKENVTEELNISGEMVIMNFLVKSSLESLTHNITYGSYSSTKFTSTYKNKDKILMIILSKDFYFNLIHYTYEGYKEIVNSIFSSNIVKLFPNDLPISPGILETIYEIQNCNRKGVLKRIFIENKIQELLLLQLELYLHISNSKKVMGIKEVEVSKLIRVKLFIDTNFTKTITIEELAQKVYLNETKLRKIFKTYFGSTIKNYITVLKMKYALELLKSKKYNITEIASLCGYNGLVQFSVAFKKMYGCSPKKLQA